MARSNSGDGSAAGIVLVAAPRTGVALPASRRNQSGASGKTAVAEHCAQSGGGTVTSIGNAVNAHALQVDVSARTRKEARRGGDGSSRWGSTENRELLVRWRRPLVSHHAASPSRGQGQPPCTAASSLQQPSPPPRLQIAALPSMHCDAEAC